MTPVFATYTPDTAIKKKYPRSSQPLCHRTRVLFSARSNARAATTSVVATISPIPVARRVVSVSPSADMVDKKMC